MCDSRVSCVAVLIAYNAREAKSGNHYLATCTTLTLVPEAKRYQAGAENQHRQSQVLPLKIDVAIFQPNVLIVVPGAQPARACVGVVVSFACFRDILSVCPLHLGFL
jgi:hypothetical protein